MHVHHLANDLAAELAARKCPIRVVDREPSQPTTYAMERVVVEIAGRDSFGAPVMPGGGGGGKPRLTHSCTTPVRLTLYVKAPQPGALEFEHEDRAIALRDMVLSALATIASRKRIRIAAGGGERVHAPDLEKSEKWPGVRYVLDVAVTTSVAVRDWAGDTAPAATVAGVETTCEIGTEGGALEAAC